MNVVPKRDRRARNEGTPASAKLQSETPPDPHEPDQERALRLIRGLILSGELEGAVTEEEMVKRVGVKRSPVHHALARLKDEGLVEIIGRRYTRVRVVTPSEVQSILGIRLALEDFVIQELLQRGNIDLRELNTIHDQMRVQTNASRSEPSVAERMKFVEADIAFHTTLARLAGHKEAVQFLERLSVKIQLFATLSLQTRTTMRAVLLEHDRIIAAIREGDKKAARSAVHQHLESAVQRCFDSYERRFRSTATKGGRKPTR